MSTQPDPPGTQKQIQQLQHIVDNVDVIISQCSRALRYIFVNRSCAAFLGRPVHEIVGREIGEVIGGPAFEKIRPYVDKVLAGEVVEYETEIPYAGAGSRWMHVVYVPDFDEQRKVHGWVAAITDISERRRAEEALKQADRRKDEFLAMLAHELRNPLAALSSAFELARQLVPAPSAAMRQAREIMERQLECLVRLVDDLLDVSRIARGKIHLQKAPVDLRDVVTRADEGSRSLIDSRAHTLEVALPERAITVEADPVRLAQVLWNLLNNAAKYTPAAGRIWLRAGEEGGQAVVRIKDTGIGIPGDMLAGVFELFAQTNRPQDRDAGGLGIGLTLVRRLTEMHGGTVEAMSAGEGQGCEFVVRLPMFADALATRPGAPLPKLEPERAAGPAARRILVVDDNDDWAETLAMLLRLSGHDVRAVPDGGRALELAADYRPDAVLLDIGLPGMDGLEVCRRLRELDYAPPPVIVAMTGHGRDEDRRRTQQAGFDAHLVKPLTVSTLEELLGRLDGQKGVDR